MTKKIIKRKKLLEWLLYYKDSIIPENEPISQHISEFYGSKKYHTEIGRYRQKADDIKGYLIYALKIFEEFLNICKKNKWTNDFIPTLLIYLNDIGNEKRLKNYSLKSLDNLVEDMSKYTTPPEICLIKKIWNTETVDDYLTWYQKNIKNEFSNIFGIQFSDEYKIYYKAISYEYKYSESGIKYQRSIYIQYNENNSETVSNIKKLSFNSN